MSKLILATEVNQSGITTEARLTDNGMILITESDTPNEPGLSIDAVLISPKFLRALYNRYLLHEKGEYPDARVDMSLLTDAETQKWHDQQALEG